MTASLDAARQFTRDYYESKVWDAGGTHFLGVPVCKGPMDLWAVGQIITECQPNVIIECGTWCGGSALYYACMQDLCGIEGMVYTIDIPDSMSWSTKWGWKRPEHKKLTYVCGSSTSPVTQDEVITNAIAFNDWDDINCMVILDSDHHTDHVAKELELWAPFVDINQYLIVEDTRIDQRGWIGNQHPGHSGPMKAVEAWLGSEQGGRFQVDRKVQPCLTFHPGGYLKCVKP